MFRLKFYAATFVVIIGLLTTFTQTARAESWSWESILSFFSSDNAVAVCISDPVVINNLDVGVGTLRQAVIDACADSTITFSNTVSGSISLSAGEIIIDKNLTIQGPGANVLTIQNIAGAGANNNIFEVNSGVTTAISGLTMSGGYTTGPGGGINNRGNLTITNTTISGNRANFGGGGIANFGKLTVTNSILSRNFAPISNGGGIYSPDGTLTVLGTIITNNTGRLGAGIYNRSTLNITDSTISDNIGTSGTNVEGGGLYNASPSATITNTTISGNLLNTHPQSGSIGRGAGIFNSSGATLTLLNSTVATNRMDTLSPGNFGGGIFNQGTVNAHNSIIAGNLSYLRNSNSTGTPGSGLGTSGLDFHGTLTSQGYNLLGNNSFTTITGDTTGNIIGTGAAPIDARLSGIGFYGGLTPTHALLTASPAINAGRTATAPPADQRGAGRVGTADIGAFELNNSANGGTFLVQLPDGLSQNPYSSTLADFPTWNSDDTDQFTFAVIAGGLPNGISMSTIFSGDDTGTPDERETVKFSGTPDQSGIFNFSVTMTNNASGFSTVTDYSLTVIDTTAPPPPGGCISNPVVVNNFDVGVGTFRQAVTDACPGSTITFGNTVTGPISLSAGQIILDKDLTIQGPGAGVLTIRNIAAAGVNNRVFQVNTGVTAAISGLTISGGYTTSAGGGIHNSGHLTVTNTTVSGSRGDIRGGGIFNSGDLTLANSMVSGNFGGAGGGTYNTGNVTLTNSTVSDNVSFEGGGIYNRGSMTLTDSTISGNTAQNGGVTHGGGLYNDGAAATATLTNSTFSSNLLSAGEATGSGIFNLNGTVTLLNSTVAKNIIGTGAITRAGAGVATQSGTVNLRNSIIAENIIQGQPGGNQDTAGTLNSQGNNLIGTAALLGPLGFYGGPTQTHALLTGSNAIEAGDTAYAPPTDQRGAGRIGTADIGAFELNNSATGGAFVAQLPDGLSQNPYSYTLILDRGAFTYSVTGGAPPSGVSLVTNGNVVLVSGTPAVSGVFNFSVTTTSGTNSNVTDYLLVIHDTNPTPTPTPTPTPPPTVTPTPTPSPTPTPNTPPNAVNDAYSVNEDTTLTTLASGVLMNDTDVENDPLTAQLQTSPAHAASFTLNANGSFSYTPNADFNGTDSFTYKASDGSLASSAATVTLTVGEVNDNPDAVSDAATVAEDSGASAINVLGNDEDAPDTGETLTISSVTQGTNGTGSITGGGTGVSYAPNANFNGTDSFTYTISDGNGGSDTATVNVTVTSVNDNPTTTDDSATVGEDSGSNAINVLSNDSIAPDTGETLTVSSVTQGASGKVAVTNGGAELNYTPNAGFSGTDSFTYIIADGNGGTDEATVNVTITAVNDPPMLDVIGSKTTDEGAALTFTASGNDNADNPNPNSLSFSLIGAPAGATITAAGAFSWTPTEAQGPDQFTFRVRVTDNGTPNLFDEEEITVTVREVNAAPLLNAIGNKSGFWGNALSFTATATDADLPANTLIYSLAGTAPAGASITAAGAFTWTPTPAQLGTHTITVLVTDNGTPSRSDSETITITIGKRPTMLVYGGASAGQYSDSVTLTGTLADNGGGTMQGALLAGKTISFTLGSQAASEVTNAAGLVVESLTLTQAAQTLNILSQFGGDALYQLSGDSDSFMINKENVETMYTGDSLIFTAGPSIGTAGSVRLAARLTEPDTELGNLTLARVRFELYKFSNSSTTPTLTFGNIAVDAAGNAETSVALAVDDAYTVRVVIEDANGYWLANPAGEGTLVVAYGTVDRRVTGGGWVPDAASANNKSHFGFTVNYRNNGSPRGNALYLFRGTDGYNYRLKTNSWQGGGLTFYGEPWKAAFSGKCNVQKLDPITGVTVQAWGNYTFTVDVVDGDLKKPRETDRYAIQVLTDAGALWRQIGTRTNPIALGGGNIAVKTK